MGLFESIELASFGEQEACRFLQKNRFKIVERNYRVPEGEIDVVAQPWEAVGFRKQQRLKKAAGQYIRQHSLRGFEYRFDVISITLDEQHRAQIEWIQCAF